MRTRTWIAVAVTSSALLAATASTTAAEDDAVAGQWQWPTWPWKAVGD